MSKKSENPYDPIGGNVFQGMLEHQIAQMPSLLLGRLMSKKLRRQGFEISDDLSERLAEHVLSASDKPFQFETGGKGEDVSLSIDDEDLAELRLQLRAFGKNKLSEMLPDLADELAQQMLKDLKSRWRAEHLLQDGDLTSFHSRLRETWKKPLSQLRMLLTTAREWCQWVHNRKSSRRKKAKQHREVLIRLLVRGCQVTDEILCLLENGFADGAMARWRTLHELHVVAAVLARHGQSITERYLAHQAVESKRAMDKYMACYQELGFKPISIRDQKAISRAYDQAIATYGRNFRFDYGWAALHLKNNRPTFSDLEAEAGHEAKRAYYQMSNDNVHAGIKSLYVRLGLAGDYSGLLAGRSNAGLAEPGQNAAHTLTQLCIIVCLTEPNLDDLVAAAIMQSLRDEIPKGFHRADERLRKNEAKYKANRAVST